MFCEKCGKKISDDSAFCEFCGQKIECGEKKENLSLEKKKGQEKENDQIASDNLKQIANHLEFLGYEIEKLSSAGEREFIAARHAKDNNMVYWLVYPNFILFRTGLKTSKKPSPKMDDFINKVNKILEMSRVYYEMIDDNLTIQFEAVFSGKYNKELFGQFLDFFKNDQTRTCSFEDFNKLFID